MGVTSGGMSCSLMASVDTVVDLGQLAVQVPGHVGQYKQLLDGGMVAHVAIKARVGLAPLLRGPAEERHVQQVGLTHVGDGGLDGCHLRRNELLLDGIGGYSS